MAKQRLCASLPYPPGLALPSAQRTGWSRAKRVDLPRSDLPPPHPSLSLPTTQRTRVEFGELKEVLVPSVNVPHFQDGHSEVQLWALGVPLMNSLPSSPLDSQGFVFWWLQTGRKLVVSPSTADTRGLELKNPCGCAAQQSLWKALETRISEPKAQLRDSDPRH